jgi:PAS domain-containing protein
LAGNFSSYAEYFALSRPNCSGNASISTEYVRSSVPPIPFPSRFGPYGPILRSVFESAVNAIVVIDRHGIVRAFNPSVERLFVHHADPVNLVERQSEDLYSLLTGMESYRVLSLDEVE